VAVVTAASKGVGRGAAEALAREGCRLAICSRDPEGIARAGQELAARHGVEVLARPCDVSDGAALEAFLGEAQDHFGQVDVLVNNAGGPPAGAFGAFSDADWLAAFQLTLMSVVRACRFVAPGMKARGWGRILTVTSVSVRQPLAGMLLSNVFRPAVAGFAKTLANELGPHGVTVHCLMPGAFLTDRNRTLGEAIARERGIQFDQLVEEWERNVPLRRMGSPEDFGELVAFLASDRAAFMTGACLPIEGGLIQGI
jgi:3-oxoacyl-[acyl-carrier protein] reductase